MAIVYTGKKSVGNNDCSSNRKREREKAREKAILASWQGLKPGQKGKASGQRKKQGSKAARQQAANTQPSRKAHYARFYASHRAFTHVLRRSAALQSTSFCRSAALRRSAVIGLLGVLRPGKCLLMPIKHVLPYRCKQAVSA